MSETAQATRVGNGAELEGARGTVKGIRVLAGLLCISTLGLIALGALVTGFGVGMAVPDWPTTFGQNMFTYPVAEAPWSVQLEHGHRLAGSWVGLLTLALAVWLWVADRRPAVRKLGLVALFAVIVQGVLGGMRVVKIDPRWAVVHGPLAQAFFAITIALFFFSRTESRAGQDAPALRRFAWITVGVIYLQIVTGAALRHLGWGLSLHLFFAAAVLVHLGLLVRKSLSHESSITPWALAAAGMGTAQLFLGVISWMTVHAGSSEGPVRNSALGAIVSTAHVVTGALLLGTLVYIALRCGARTSREAA